VTKKETSYILRLSYPFTTLPYYLDPNDKPVRKFPIIFNPTLAGGRVVLYGGNNPEIEKRVRLRITYFEDLMRGSYLCAT
jgi:hypothetical protein